MNIKELRIAQKLSQSELAKKLDVTPGAIGHLETGRRKASAKLAAKVKEVFGVELDTGTEVQADEVKAAPAKAAKAKKPVRKQAAKAEKTKKAEKAEKAPARKTKSAKLEIYVQSPLGGNITPEEIAAKLPDGAEAVFVRVDQNKLWWIKGEETGSVDIW